MFTQLLHNPTSLDEFRQAARGLLAQQRPPEAVHWAVAGQGSDLLWSHSADTADATDSTKPQQPAQPPRENGAPAPTNDPPRVPADFLNLCRTVLLHRDPRRHALLYQLLWRLLHEPALRHDPLDAGIQQAHQMAKAVRRDIHKMRAFVRFRQVLDPDCTAAGDLDEEPGSDPASDPDQTTPVHPTGPVRHVAWFEPEHHTVVANAPFFVRRFAQMRWAILSPDACIEWDGQQLHTRPGADRSQAPPADAGEQLWLTYYQHIFNPARLKLAAMCKEMPKRYWHNLPEAVLIAPLSAGAEARTLDMVAATPGTPRRIKPMQRPG